MAALGLIVIAFIIYFLIKAIKDRKRYEAKERRISEIVRKNNHLKIDNIKWFEYEKDGKKGLHKSAECISIIKDINIIRMSPFLIEMLTDDFQDLSINQIISRKDNDEVFIAQPLYGYHNDEITLVFSDDHIFLQNGDDYAKLHRDAAWRFTDKV